MQKNFILYFKLLIFNSVLATDYLPECSIFRFCRIGSRVCELDLLTWINKTIICL